MYEKSNSKSINCSLAAVGPHGLLTRVGLVYVHLPREGNCIITYTTNWVVTSSLEDSVLMTCLK